MKDGPRTTGQLSKDLPELTRFAVMQHLGVLEEAGLVLSRKEGKSRFNYLNPIPLRQTLERWLTSSSSTAAETALHLKRYAETRREVAQQMDQNDYRFVKIEMEMKIDAPRERVFAALTEELNNWWPHRFKPDSQVSCDVRVGGRIEERFANGGGAVYGEIVYMDAPFQIASGGTSALNRGMSSYSMDTLEEDGESTVLKRNFQIWGYVPENVEKMYREGSRQIMEVALNRYLRDGIGYQVPA
ncbi:hypothetical protein [Fimbriimonas ginsengisoli]